MSDYTYVRTNSKGEAVLRRDTEDTFEFVVQYLKEKDIEYEYRDGATMFILWNDADVRYVYYWTTGRWAVKTRKINKHFSSKGIVDFVERFLNRYAEEQKKQHEVWAEEKRVQREEYFRKKQERLNNEAT